MIVFIVDFPNDEANRLKTIFEAEEWEIISHGYSKDIFGETSVENFGVMVINVISEKENASLKRIQSIRKESMIPILVLSENDDKTKKLLAFDYGADDFILKPCDEAELVARVKILVRRESYYRNIQMQSTEIIFDDLQINTIKRRVLYKNKPIDFTNKEFDLFVTLVSSPNEIFQREKLLEKVWGYSYFGDLRTVDVHIRRIRQKLEQAYPDSSIICTKWGAGYYFDAKLV